MNFSFGKILEQIRSSYWFVPAMMSLMACGLATLMLHLDQRFTGLETAYEAALRTVDGK